MPNSGCRSLCVEARRRQSDRRTYLKAFSKFKHLNVRHCDYICNSLAFSVTLFCTEACLVMLVLLLRRTKSIGGELGGPFVPKLITSMILFFLWVFYLVMSTLEAYGVFEGF